MTIMPPDSACNCLVTWLDGAGNHSPGCAIFRWKPPPSVDYPDDHSEFCPKSCDHPCHDAYDKWAAEYGSREVDRG